VSAADLSNKAWDLQVPLNICLSQSWGKMYQVLNWNTSVFYVCLCYGNTQQNQAETQYHLSGPTTQRKDSVIYSENKEKSTCPT